MRRPRESSDNREPLVLTLRDVHTAGYGLDEAKGRIAELEAEVARLKAELAAVTGEDHADRCAQGKRLREELRAMRAEREWRPIETAPEGVDVLVAFAGRRRVATRREHWWECYEAGEIRVLLGVTHWMSLPEPPKGGAS